MPPLLALRSVSRRFGRRRAVTDVTLALAAGEVVLLVGANGAGKTTLLRIAAGYLDADAGELAVDGRLGYLPEAAPAPAELAVVDHLRLRARLKGATRGTVDAVVARAVAGADIAEVSGQRIGTLSKGFRQRVGLADALLGDPAVLLLDEPTSGMDPIQVRQLRALIGGDASAACRAVLVSSHAVADLAPIATRIAVLRAGALVADGTAAELCAQTACAAIDDAVIALLAREVAA